MWHSIKTLAGVLSENHKLNDINYQLIFSWKYLRTGNLKASLNWILLFANLERQQIFIQMSLIITWKRWAESNFPRPDLYTLRWYPLPLTLPSFPVGLGAQLNPLFLTWHYLMLGLEGGWEIWVTKLEIGAHQTVEQIPILLLGTVQKSRYPSLVAEMPKGESAQVTAGGGEATPGNMCM